MKKQPKSKIWLTEALFYLLKTKSFSKITINDIAKKYPQKIRIGVHSKGGNLAVYSAVFASEEIKQRILNVYNNDGPGFSDEIINTKEYKEMIKKVHTYIPQSSVI